jgi:hypothetical protein
MTVSVKNADISTIPQEEINAYKKYVQEKYPDEVIDEIILEFEGEDVKIETHKHSIPFNRIRRITGYVVPSLTKWNNAKLSELKYRVKHNVETPHSDYENYES